MPTTITGTTISSTFITGSSVNLTGGSQGFITPTSGSSPYYGARAWVNFNGTGTVAIRGSSNVSSITDNNVGQYTVNFSTAMPDTNYAVVANNGNNAVTNVHCNVTNITSNASVNLIHYENNSVYDIQQIFLVIFR
jgi:hypothetical protein